MSTLYTDNIRANNASQITVPAGQTLYAPGHVLQVIEGPEFGTSTNVTATSYFDLGLSVTITPKSSSSKIFVMLNVHCYINGTGFIGIRVMRGSTEVVEAPRAWGWQDNSSSIVNLSKLDSPTTTSATTYRVQVKAVGASNLPRVNDGSGPSRITVMEIAQ